MKSVKLFPVQKNHCIGFPFAVNVDDSNIDLDDTTPVRAHLGFRKTLQDAEQPSPDLPGDDLYMHGIWAAVAHKIEEITPTEAGYYSVVVIAYLNIAPPGTPIKRACVKYQSVPIHVID